MQARLVHGKNELAPDKGDGLVSAHRSMSLNGTHIRRMGHTTAGAFTMQG